jgi:hypothetical protein
VPASGSSIAPELEPLELLPPTPLLDSLELDDAPVPLAPAWVVLLEPRVVLEEPFVLLALPEPPVEVVLPVPRVATVLSDPPVELELLAPPLVITPEVQPPVHATSTTTLQAGIRMERLRL